MPEVSSLSVDCTEFLRDKELKRWSVKASLAAKECRNRIREVLENFHLEPNPEKSVISFSIGDPTVYGNLQPSSATVEATIEAVKSGFCNGYNPSVGSEEARKAVADYLSIDGVSYNLRDIILCSGCSSSLELSITVLADYTRNHNILLPRPGFPLYFTIARTLGIQERYYNLIPETNWKVDVDHLESLIDDKTAAIVLNNPSNPCGSVYDSAHLKEILQVALRYKIPVICDEIYERLVFPGTQFISAASVNPGVPLLICGGLAKRFLIPGWRMGWIAFHDPNGAFEPEIRKGLACLSQKTVGSNSLVQGALPTILLTEQAFHDNLITTLHENATLAYNCLKDIDGLVPFMPDGTMYMMVKIELEHFPAFNTGMDFMQRLMEEESVFCLAGECFGIEKFVRIVITIPAQLIEEACERMTQFCRKHYTNQKK